MSRPKSHRRRGGGNGRYTPPSNPRRHRRSGHIHRYDPDGVYRDLLGDATKQGVPELVTVPDIVLSKLIPREVMDFVAGVEAGTMPVFHPDLSTQTVQMVVYAAVQYAHLDDPEAFTPDGPGEAMLIDLGQRCGMIVEQEARDGDMEFAFGIDPDQTDRFSQASVIAMNRIGLIGHISPEVQV